MPPASPPVPVQLAQPTSVSPQPGVSVTPASAAQDPALVYQAFRAQRRVLDGQLDALHETRREIVGQLRQGTVSETDRRGLEQQLAQVDQRIATVSGQLAEADANVARSAAIPGATVEPPRPDPWQHGPPPELVALSFALIGVLLLPLLIAWARRIWRRSAVAITLPPELAQRMTSLERAVDAVSIEVERVGEGQRFVTQLLAARADAPPRVPLSVPAAERSEGPGAGGPVRR